MSNATGKQYAHALTSLSHNETFTIDGFSNQENPHKFFKDRRGLCIWSGFEEFVLQNAKQVKLVSASTLSSFNLAKASNDAEIRAELPEGHVFEDLDEFCALLALLVTLQWGGKKGWLLNNRYANIFYVRIMGEVVAVDVLWDSGDARWCVDAFQLGDGRWGVGRRAFSATAVT